MRIGLRRVTLLAEMAILGDESTLPRLVAFLRDPPTLSKNRERQLRGTMLRALKAISVHHYKPALPVMKTLEIAPHLQGFLDVFTAQLEENAPALEQYVQDSVLTSAALFALNRMGRDEIVREIASDSRNPARPAAEAVLRGQREP